MGNGFRALNKERSDLSSKSRASHEAREASALRENLLKRKAQQKDRALGSGLAKTMEASPPVSFSENTSEKE